MASEIKKEKTKCYHCGDPCREDLITFDQKSFCCQGCKSVYQILDTNSLGNFYAIESHAGQQPKSSVKGKYDFLEDEKLQEKLILFKDEERAGVSFHLPQIHCSACIWLLERLYKFNPAIVESKVNFLKKEATIVFIHQELDLKAIAQILDSIGYAPNISLDEGSFNKRKKKKDRKLTYQIGLAGFAFGNIMLLSLPEYLGIHSTQEAELSRLFNWLNLVLATPVAIYSGQDYFRSAWLSLKQKRLNIDVPIALGVMVLYLRSTYEIVAQVGSGYFDSLCGLLFFLLLGRLFQQKVYHKLSFERDYRSYFPIAVTQITSAGNRSIPLQQLAKGDRILVRNGELIPVDAQLIKGEARLDNSFISGESKLISKKPGEKIYAGGRQSGSAIELEVIKPLNQSRLTALWNRYAQMNKGKEYSSFSKSTDAVSQWFTPILLIIALGSALFHLSSGWGQAIEIFSAVLIVACPCALALAAPFTFGHGLRKAGKYGCYMRDAGVLENLASIEELVFDKTGTLTIQENARIRYQGGPLNNFERSVFFHLLSQSTHPLSKIVAAELYNSENKYISFDHFEEIEGKGLMGVLDGKVYQAGSALWLGAEISSEEGSQIVLAFEKEIIGTYTIQKDLRKSISKIIKDLAGKFRLSMLSGDKQKGNAKVVKLFPSETAVRFNQSPEDKVKFIQDAQAKGIKIAMIGDGLNDSAALQQSDIGISISDDIHSFAPASDIILKGKSLSYLPSLLDYAKYSRHVVWASFTISFIYNIVGLSFAVQGLLSPVFAAILMPVSSISVVGFVSLASWMKNIQET